MQILDEILHDIMPEIEKNYDESSDSKETDIESDFDDEIPDEKIFVPKLQLDRLLTARSIKSGIKDINNFYKILCTNLSK